MMSKSTADESRRNFLKMATVGAPAAAAVAVVSAPATSEAASAEAAGEGLRMTPHVKAYLDSARF